MNFAKFLRTPFFTEHLWTAASIFLDLSLGPAVNESFCETFKFYQNCQFCFNKDPAKLLRNTLLKKTKTCKQLLTERGYSHTSEICGTVFCIIPENTECVMLGQKQEKHPSKEQYFSRSTRKTLR